MAKFKSSVLDHPIKEAYAKLTDAMREERGEKEVKKLMAMVNSFEQSLPKEIANGPYINEVLRPEALIMAAMTDNAKVVDSMLDKGVDVNKTYTSDFTALHLAAGNGAANAVKALLSRGADTKKVDKFGRYPATLAAENKFSDVSQLIQDAHITKSSSRTINLEIDKASSMISEETTKGLSGPKQTPTRRASPRSVADRSF